MCKIINNKIIRAVTITTLSQYRGHGMPTMGYSSLPAALQLFLFFFLLVVTGVHMA